MFSLVSGFMGQITMKYYEYKLILDVMWANFGNNLPSGND